MGRRWIYHIFPDIRIRPSIIIYFCCGFFSLSNSQGFDGHETENDGTLNPVVFLTVSSLASSYNDCRRLELNWYNIPEINDSSIRLYTHDPIENTVDFLVLLEPSDYPENYFRTTIQFPEHIFTANNLTDECLGYWIAYMVSEEIVASSCIRARAHWMYNMKDIIGNASLIDLVLPGTHNAGSYASYDPDSDSIFRRYLFNQDESIFNQLVYGIRYLDLRVSYERLSDTSEIYWITHSVFRTDLSVREVISQVKEFLNATNEIVIMDFHRFVTGFSSRRGSLHHRGLIDLLERELSDYMIPINMLSQTPLHSLWESGRRLYVGYASNAERARSQYLFPAVRHLWGDKDDREQLFGYLNQSVCNQRRPRLTSAMAQLTPTTSGAIFDSYGGLRKMADNVNRHVTTWFRDLWWNCANIISTDYFLGNHIVETAIQTNKRRFSS